MTQERLWQPSDILPHDQDGDTPKRRGRIPQSAWPVILERYRNGATLSAIAREFDCTPSAISYIVRKAEAAVGGEGASEHAAPSEQPAAQAPSLSAPSADDQGASAAPVAATPQAAIPDPASQTTPPAPAPQTSVPPSSGDRGERPRHDRPRSERPQRERPQQERSNQERSNQDRQGQDRAGNERAAGDRFQSDRSQRQRPADFAAGERPARQDRPAGERRTLTGAAVANAVQERSSAAGGISQGQRSYSDRMNSERAAAEFADQDAYIPDVDGSDRFANRPVGSEYPYRQQQRNAARQEAAETPTEPADIRLANATTRSAAAYTAWKANPGEVGMQSLTEALHDLRKVIARMEIEMSASRKDEHAARPIPIPYHRAQRR